MRLYGIQESEVRATLDSPDSLDIEGDRQVALKSVPGRFSGFPLKVVYTMEGGGMLVVTAYPLKRSYKR